MTKGKRLLLIAPFALAGLAVFIALGGWVVMQLWNWLVPDLFGGKTVTWWQAVGLLALGRILFGGFSMQDSSRDERRRRMTERWERMTPEEREQTPVSYTHLTLPTN